MDERFRLFDVLRGFSVLSMVAFHMCYDLKFIFGIDLAWFEPPLQDIWRASISWTFLLVAGCMCSLSKNNLKRACRYAGLALGIFVATTIIAVDDPISFGIIYCMAACTFVDWALDACGIAPRGIRAAAILFLCFALLLELPKGFVGIGPMRAQVPAELYSTPWLSWLGLPGPGFVSGDYYPLLPYLFLYLSGAALGRHFKEVGFPPICKALRCRPLEFVGRHPLEIYVAHQPVILLLCNLLIRP